MSYLKELAALKYTNHLMLPLVGVHWFNVQQWLIESWVYWDMKHVVIETTNKIPQLRIGKYYFIGGRHFYKLPVPERLVPDVKRFIDGKYSQFSDHARRLVKDLSGLQYEIEHPVTKQKHTHVLIIAIDNSEEMTPWRTPMREALSMEIYGDAYQLSEDTELLSPPAVREQVIYEGELP